MQGIFLRHDVTIRTAQVAHQNYRFGSIVQAVFNAGNGSLNPTKSVFVCVGVCEY